MTDRALADDGLTVAERAIIDLQKQQQAIMARKATFGGTKTEEQREPGDTLLHPEYIDALCPPCRIEITFDHPIKTREQLEVLQSMLAEALVVTQDHKRGINRQRLDLRHIVKTCADVLTLMNGKTPSGQYHKLKRRKTPSSS